MPLQHWALSIRHSSYQPQQSVLYPQFGHRQTACIRNISAWPQRSQITLSASHCPEGVGGDWT